jgi:hypothetical protein
LDPVRNPFAPGAGSQPPELAGRDHIIGDATVAMQRALLGRSSRSQILLGLRGVGKTVLLNTLEQKAEDLGLIVSFIEAPEGRTLADLLLPKLMQTLRKLSLTESSKALAYQGQRALRSFAGRFKLSYGDVGLSVDPEPGTADSGNLEYDLSELFLRVGRAAQAAGKGWVLLIDEVQYLKEQDYAALIVALHRAGQRNLPVLFFGAGLPQVAVLSGEAKSYAERLFAYPQVGPLDDVAAALAIRSPIEDEGATISQAALNEIFAQTKGYPYFLQEWGYQCWNLSNGPAIGLPDVKAATSQALHRLDEGFFRVRFDRLTPKERDYVLAMAQLGEGPYRSSEVAELLGEKVNALGPRRASIISKGMIYSPAHGDIGFTVPMFDDYLRRNWDRTEEPSGSSLR